MTVIDLFSQSPTTFLVSAGILGAFLGSFLNVVVHRLPIMLERRWTADCREHLELAQEDSALSGPYNLVVPRSACPACGRQIRAWENIPVISYLILRGKCSGCGTSISAQYPLVEILTAILSVIVAWQFGFSYETAAAWAFTWALVALAVIDLRTKLLPDTITLPFVWLGLMVNMGGLYTDLQASVLGAVAGYLSLWLVYQLFKQLTGKEGMGYGDFKLLAMLGAWLGWSALPLIIILSSLVGAVVGIAMIIFRGRDRNIPIPFGPYLAIAGWIALLWGPQINQLYLDLAL